MSSSSNKTKGGRPESAVWTHIKKGKKKSNGHYQATCNYCKHFWENRKPQKLRFHLTNKCPLCPEHVVAYFAKIVAEEIVSSSESESSDPHLSKKKKIQPKLNEFYKPDFLQIGREEKINKVLLKAFVMCGIPWSAIENPYFIELLKVLQPGYKSPSRKQLSTIFLENEVARINRNVEKIINGNENITLGKYYLLLFDIYYLII
jgi:hypothetical protein